MQAYDVALRLFELAEQLSAGNTETLLSMVCPADSHADDNPVFVLCRNDACSFTWTGEEHVQQVGGVRWVESGGWSHGFVDPVLCGLSLRLVAGVVWIHAYNTHSVIPAVYSPLPSSSLPLTFPSPLVTSLHPLPPLPLPPPHPPRTFLSATRVGSLAPSVAAQSVHTTATGAMTVHSSEPARLPIVTAGREGSVVLLLQVTMHSVR